MEAKDQLLRENSWIGCHDCDLLYEVEELPVDSEARCSRCGAFLYRNKPNSISRTLAFVLAGLMLYIPANFYPIMSLQALGQAKGSTLFSGVLELYNGGLEMVAVLIFLTSIAIPLLKLLTLLYVLLSIQLKKRSPGLISTFHVFQKLDTWGMLEVYMLGILVAIIKLADLATVITGLGLYSFVALLLITVCSSATLDARVIWKKLEEYNNPTKGQIE